MVVALKSIRYFHCWIFSLVLVGVLFCVGPNTMTKIWALLIHFKQMGVVVVVVVVLAHVLALWQDELDVFNINTFSEQLRL